MRTAFGSLMMPLCEEQGALKSTMDFFATTSPLCSLALSQLWLPLGSLLHAQCLCRALPSLMIIRPTLRTIAILTVCLVRGG